MRTATTTKGVMRPSEPPTATPGTDTAWGRFMRSVRRSGPCRLRGMTRPRTGPPGAAPTPSSRWSLGTDNREVDAVEPILSQPRPSHTWAELLGLEA